MKVVAYISISLLTTWGILALLQLWFHIISYALFTKITISFVVILVISVVVALIKREYADEKEMRKNDFID